MLVALTSIFALATSMPASAMPWTAWASAHGVACPKLAVSEPLVEERGKGGVSAAENIAAMEVIATIPRELVLTADDEALRTAQNAREPTWAAELTAAALMAMHPQVGTNWASDSAELAQKAWLDEWRAGGWATDAADLGNEDVRWGARDVTGSLLATGSDNDENIYAKFRFPCQCAQTAATSNPCDFA